MFLIRFALRRPWTVMVAVVALLMSGGVAYQRQKTDIFPSLNMPVIYVCQPYGGMDPAQMEGLIANLPVPAALKPDVAVVPECAAIERLRNEAPLFVP